MDIFKKFVVLNFIFSISLAMDRPDEHNEDVHKLIITQPTEDQRITNSQFFLITFDPENHDAIVTIQLNPNIAADRFLCLGMLQHNRPVQQHTYVMAQQAAYDLIEQLRPSHTTDSKNNP